MTKSKKSAKKNTLILKCVLIIIVILVAAIAGYFFVRTIVDKKTLLDSGEQVVGVVEERDVHLTTARTTSLTSRMISYSFTPAGSTKRITQNDFYVSRGEYEKYSTGSQIAITYLPSDPSFNQPTKSLRHMSSKAEPFVYLILVIVLAIFSSRIVKRIQTKHNIKSPGWPFYLTSLAGFMAAFAVAGLFIIIISWLVTLVLA